MNGPLSAQEALYQLLGVTWDPQAVPPAESIPWPDVLDLVKQSNLAGLLYTVTGSVRDSMPPAVRQAIQRAYYLSVAANERCFHQVAEVGRALSGVGAPLLLLKGAALADMLYPKPPMRPIGDIDLVVPFGDVPACREVLLQLGYRLSPVEPWPGSHLVDSNQRLFQRPSSYHIPLEVHWHVFTVPYYQRKVPMDWFWKNSETRSIAGQLFQVLNAEANLLYLPAHAALGHRLEGLHSLLDLALLVVQNRDRLDWDRIITTARSFDLLEALREALDHLAGAWPSLPLDEPRQLLQSFKPSPTGQRLLRVRAQGPQARTMGFFSILVTLPDLAARTRFVWFNIFPEPAYMKWKYGVATDWQLPYYYLRRLWQGLPRFVRALPHAWRIGRQRRESMSGEGPEQQTGTSS